MSYHAARGETKALQNLVLLASQVTFVVAAPLALTFALVPHSVLFSWTGSMVISNTVGAVLALYALGYLGAALVTPSYYLQLAMGNLRLQIIGRIAFVIVLVPTILFATWSYGMWGAGVVWSVENFIYLALWVPVMFRKDLPLVVVPWSKQILTQSAVLGAVYLGLSILGLDRWNGSSRLFDGLVAVCVWLAFSGIALALNRAVAKGALRTLRNIGNRVLPNTVRT